MKANPADYDLVSPGSLESVLALIAQEPGAWTPIAGGTELMVQFGAGRLQARKLVNIYGLPELTSIAITEDSIRIGAGVTYTTLRNHPVLTAELPLLARAASWTGAIANQNRGTLGGNLVNGSPAADSPPALLAYDAQLSLVSVRGVRRIPYAEFHTGYKQTALEPDELVLAIHLPRATYTHQYLRKVGPRNAQAISKVALGAVANITNGHVTEIRIGLASVSHSPFRCIKTEASLLGATLDQQTFSRAKAALLGEITPLDDIRSTARYRKQVAANLLAEFLQQLAATQQPRSLLDQWNALPPVEAIGDLLACCGSRRWAETLTAQRPFRTEADLLEAADKLWFSLPEPDWLEAFSCHPRIGEKKAATTQYLASSETEQAAAQQTLDQVADALIAGNRAYEERFGFLYVVFASGRTAPELLQVLETRLTHTREEELREAAEQQHRITTLRMRKWLAA